MSDSSGDASGLLLMTAGAGFLLLSDAVTKLLVEDYPLWQVLILRQATATIPLLAYAALGPGLSILRPTNWGGQLIRGLCFLVTVWLVVVSLSLLPLPTVTALAFASPIFVAALSVPMLQERVGWRSGLAILCGFLGVLVILQPGSVGFEWALLLPLGAAFTAGLRDLLTRRLSRGDTSMATLFWSCIVVVGASLPSVAIGGWVYVPLGDWPLVLLCGLLNTTAHFLMIESLRLGRAALVAPFRYSALLWSVIVGYLVWGDLPGVSTLVGGAIIVASGVYMIRRGRL